MKEETQEERIQARFLARKKRQRRIAKRSSEKLRSVCVVRTGTWDGC